MQINPAVKVQFGLYDDVSGSKRQLCGVAVVPVSTAVLTKPLPGLRPLHGVAGVLALRPAR
ncbi:hypothetical protein [Streptomyces luteolifulvus]|uniref:hypothetical protein n=1 Tax=Streptomyces luteolifulvus TaxID=2615112 RepID=UPI00177FF370|nr:hypothetical protein [Streptomyces luteolifulvus]